MEQSRRQRAGECEAEQQDDELPAAREQDSTLADDVDSILDEIDDVLEENAEEFVKSYIQKGGQ